MPIAGWMDDWLPSMDWSHVDFINMVIDAIQERQAALGVSAVSNVSTGDDVQAASFWATLQNAISSMADEGNFVATIDSTGNSRIVDRYDGWEGDYGSERSIPDWVWTADAGDDISVGILYHVSEMEGKTWRRKKPRTIDGLNLSSATDTDGNTSPTNAVAYYGSKRYTWNGTIWSEVTTNPNPVVDTLDSSNASGGGSYCAPGACQAGDYLGPWIWSQMRAILNELIWTQHAASLTDTESKQGYGGPRDTWANADNDAQADWALESWAGPTGTFFAHHESAWNSYYHYSIYERGAAKITASSIATSTVNHVFDVLVYASCPVDPTTYTDSSFNTQNVTGLVENAWGRVEVSSAGTATGYTSALLGKTETLCATASPASESVPAIYKGWQSIAQRMLVRYEGGFAYTRDT